MLPLSTGRLLCSFTGKSCIWWSQDLKFRWWTPSGEECSHFAMKPQYDNKTTIKLAEYILVREDNFNIQIEMVKLYNLCRNWLKSKLKSLKCPYEYIVCFEFAFLEHLIDPNSIWNKLTIFRIFANWNALLNIFLLEHISATPYTLSSDPFLFAFTRIKPCPPCLSIVSSYNMTSTFADTLSRCKSFWLFFILVAITSASTLVVAKGNLLSAQQVKSGQTNVLQDVFINNNTSNRTKPQLEKSLDADDGEEAKQLKAEPSQVGALYLILVIGATLSVAAFIVVVAISYVREHKRKLAKKRDQMKQDTMDRKTPKTRKIKRDKSSNTSILSTSDPPNREFKDSKGNSNSLRQ